MVDGPEEMTNEGTFFATFACGPREAFLLAQSHILELAKGTTVKHV
jgi:hypothetical protein